MSHLHPSYTPPFFQFISTLWGSFWTQTSDLLRLCESQGSQPGSQKQTWLYFSAYHSPGRSPCHRRVSRHRSYCLWSSSSSSSSRMGWCWRPRRAALETGSSCRCVWPPSRSQCRCHLHSLLGHPLSAHPPAARWRWAGQASSAGQQHKKPLHHTPVFK